MHKSLKHRRPFYLRVQERLTVTSTIVKRLGLGNRKSNAEKEGDTEEITVEETRIELLSVAQSHVGAGGCKGTPGGENSPELRESATSVRHIQDDESVTSITSPRRAQAKKRWIKVRKNCAFLASQTGRQVNYLYVYPVPAERPART